MNNGNGPKHISSFLTGLPFLNDDLLVDWDDTFDPNKLIAPITSDRRWVTAIQKVDPKSGSFWYDYGKRYGEKVMMKINTERDPKGRRCCDVMIFSCRSVGDVVFSAWEEYNRFLTK